MVIFFVPFIFLFSLFPFVCRRSGFKTAGPNGKRRKRPPARRPISPTAASASPRAGVSSSSSSRAGRPPPSAGWAAPRPPPPLLDTSRRAPLPTPPPSPPPPPPPPSSPREAGRRVSLFRFLIRTATLAQDARAHPVSTVICIAVRWLQRGGL